jgi:hypothetical protein
MESTPLPVSLLEFTAQAITNSEVRCKWVTAAEINNDYFVLERSKNGFDFQEVAIVDGAGNSNHLLSYTHTDLNPLSGISYYRLKQVDFDGRLTYSQIVSVTLLDEQNGFVLFPNPTSGNCFMNWDSELGNVWIAIYDISGKIVRQLASQNEKGVLEMDFTDLSSGFYFTEVITGNGTKWNAKLQILH